MKRERGGGGGEKQTIHSKILKEEKTRNGLYIER